MFSLSLSLFCFPIGWQNWFYSFNFPFSFLFSHFSLCNFNENKTDNVIVDNERDQNIDVSTIIQHSLLDFNQNHKVPFQLSFIFNYIFQSTVFFIFFLIYFFVHFFLHFFSLYFTILFIHLFLYNCCYQYCGLSRPLFSYSKHL